MKAKCRDAEAKLYQYLDGEMGRFSRWRLRRHLRNCPPCSEGYAFEEKLKRKVRDECVDDVPKELLDRIKTFLRQNGPTDTSG